LPTSLIIVVPNKEYYLEPPTITVQQITVVDMTNCDCKGMITCYFVTTRHY